MALPFCHVTLKGQNPYSWRDTNRKTLVCREMKAVRKACGLSQEAVARMLGVSPDSISGWETGRKMPYQRMIPKIQTFLETASENPMKTSKSENDTE